MEDETKMRFDRWAEGYDRNLIVKLFAPNPLLLLDELNLAPDSKILDVGCGTGTLVLALSRICREGEAVGIDFSERMIEVARKKAIDVSNVDFDIGEAGDLPYEDGYFDFVTCTTAFHHFPEKLKALREMERVLKRGGRLYLLEGITFGFFEKLFEILGWGHHRFTPEDIRRYFEEAGFSEIYQRELKRTSALSRSLLTVGRKV
ncbi:MAG: class I SAM-dependent methyltransferase [Candidatus Hydrothermarchaeales archaeon]